MLNQNNLNESPSPEPETELNWPLLLQIVNTQYSVSHNTWLSMHEDLIKERHYWNFRLENGSIFSASVKSDLVLYNDNIIKQDIDLGLKSASKNESLLGDNAVFKGDTNLTKMINQSMINNYFQFYEFAKMERNKVIKTGYNSLGTFIMSEPERIQINMVRLNLNPALQERPWVGSLRRISISATTNEYMPVRRRDNNPPSSAAFYKGNFPSFFR
jgi:hypothetical protein